MDGERNPEQEAAEALVLLVENLPPALDVIAAHLTVTRALVDVVRERLGIESAELRERAYALAAAAGDAPAGVMAQIAAMLPDAVPVAPDPRKRH